MALVVEGEIGEADGFIVGVGESWGELPLVIMGNLQHPVVIFLVARCLCCGEKSVVECGVGPVNVVPIIRVLDLPVGNELHGFLDVATFELRGEVSREGPGIVGLIAGGGEFVHRRPGGGLRWCAGNGN